MTLLRLLVNAIVGGALLFAWSNLGPAFLGDPQPYPRDSDPYSFGRTLAACLADFAIVLIAGWLLWLAAPRVSSMRWRVLFVASLGLLAGLAADVPLARRPASATSAARSPTRRASLASTGETAPPNERCR